jgi:hypothetical protein
MFSFAFVYLFLKLTKKGHVTVDGAYILAPIIADCWFLFQVLQFYKG